MVRPMAFLDLVDGDEASILALVRVRREHALVEELPEGFRRPHMTEVEEHLVPEPRVKEVQDRMLRTADVQVDPARVHAAVLALALEPVALGLVGEHARPIRRIAVAQVVPA